MDEWAILYEKLDTLLEWVAYLCAVCGIGFGLTIVAIWLGGKSDE